MAKISTPRRDPVYPDVRTFVTAHNSDLTEGRGHTVYVEYFDNVREAVKAAKGIDVQGSDGTVYEIITIWPDKKKPVWGEYYIGSGFKCRNTGYLPDTEWYDPMVDADIVRKTADYQKYIEYRDKFGRYDPDWGPISHDETD